MHRRSFLAELEAEERAIAAAIAMPGVTIARVELPDSDPYNRYIVTGHPSITTIRVPGWSPIVAMLQDAGIA